MLKKLLTALDDERHRIYVHIDANVKHPPLKALEDCVHQGVLNIFSSYHIYPGGSNNTMATMKLLEKAVADGCDFCHRVSTDRLPAMDNDAIREYFRINGDAVCFTLREVTPEIVDRVRYYHLPARMRDSLLSRAFIGAQRILKVDRMKRFPEKKLYRAGTEFSLSWQSAREVLNNGHFVLDCFRHADHSDELFVPTVLMNSSLAFRRTDFCL